MSDFGFVITRNIRSDIHAQYWRECVRCIRKFHTDPILIVDDNSTVTCDYAKEEQEFPNIRIIKSELPGAGEVLGYYYGHKMRLFNTFVVLHDSMFISCPFPSTVTNAKFVWHFERYQGQTREQFAKSNGDRNIDYIRLLPEEHKVTIETLYFDKPRWLGCFGVAAMIRLEFLDRIFEKYKFADVIAAVKVRHDREAMERIFALLCIAEYPELINVPSVCGSILTDYKFGGLKWHEYMRRKESFQALSKVVKVYSGR
jgi:hypothetical protein